MFDPSITAISAFFNEHPVIAWSATFSVGWAAKHILDRQVLRRLDKANVRFVDWTAKRSRRIAQQRAEAILDELAFILTLVENPVAVIVDRLHSILVCLAFIMVPISMLMIAAPTGNYRQTIVAVIILTVVYGNMLKRGVRNTRMLEAALMPNRFIDERISRVKTLYRKAGIRSTDADRAMCAQLGRIECVLIVETETGVVFVKNPILKTAQV